LPLNGALYAHGDSALVDYNWTCLACNIGVDKINDRCPNCGYLAGANSYEVDARTTLIKNSECEHALDCPKCSKRQLDIKYHKIPKEHYYIGLKGRFIFFEILYLNIFCKKCSYKKEIEFDIPVFRKLFRLLMKRDIQSEWLKRI